MLHLSDWLQLQGHERSLEDAIMWQLIEVHQLLVSTIATPMTTRQKSLDHLITTLPRLLSPLQLCLDSIRTHITGFSMDIDNE